MVKIQIDLSEDEDRIVEIYKLTNKLKTKQDAIKRMIKYFDADVKPKRIGKEEYFK
jgi:flavoprotein